jgi:hypothetical protein
LRAEPELALGHYRRAIELANGTLDMRQDDAAVRDLLAVVQGRLDFRAGGGRPGDGPRACASAKGREGSFELVCRSLNATA